MFIRSIGILFFLSLYIFSFAQNYAGIVGDKAPAWDIESWIDESGNPVDIQLDNFEGKKIRIGLCRRYRKHIIEFRLY